MMPEPPAIISLISRSTCADRSASWASRASEKPIAFSRRISAASCGRPSAANLRLGIDDLLQTLEKPGIKARNLR